MTADALGGGPASGPLTVTADALGGGPASGPLAPAADPGHALPSPGDRPASAAAAGREPVQRCAGTSRALEEPLLGTASTVRIWLLLEQPSSWDSTALASRRLPEGLGAELARRANRHRVRIVLIRRPGRTPPGGRRTCFVASSRISGSWLGEVTLDAPEDVLDLDLSTLAAGEVAGARTVDDPIFCVCTHGRHDTCCAERGKPVAAALAAAYPEQTWEISHIGGDRFAGNLVCLPHGDYLGALTPATVVPVARAYLSGEYTIANLRGRSTFAPTVQAAEILTRQQLGVTGRSAVQVVATGQASGATVVRLAVDGHGTVDARVTVGTAGPSRALTCTATAPQQPPAYELVSLTTVSV